MLNIETSLKHQHGKRAILGGKIELDLDVVRSFAHVEDDEIFLVGGTLIEGIGNFASDLDCYAFVENRPLFGNIPFKHVLNQMEDMKYCSTPEDELYLSLDYYPDSLMHLEVEYSTFDEISLLSEELDSEYKDALANTTFLSYSRIKGRKWDVLHRGRSAIVLQGHNKFNKILPLKSMIPRLCYILYRSTANFYWEFKDIIGAVEIGDADLCFETTREYLFTQIQGFLFLTGVTNSRKRWIYTYIDKMELRHKNLVNRFKEILFRGAPSEDDKMHYVIDSVRLCDDILSAERKILDASEHYQNCHTSLELLEKELKQRKGHPSDILDEEFSYRRRIYTPGADSLLDMLAL